jgi:hypothetical protein
MRSNDGYHPFNQENIMSEQNQNEERGEHDSASSSSTARSPEQIEKDSKLKRALDGAASDDELGRGTDTSRAQKGSTDAKE